MTMRFPYHEVLASQGHAAHIKEEVNFYRNVIEGWLVNRCVSGFILLVSSVLIWLTKEAKLN